MAAVTYCDSPVVFFLMATHSNFLPGLSLGWALLASDNSEAFLDLSLQLSGKIWTVMMQTSTAKSLVSQTHGLEYQLCSFQLVLAYHSE